MPSWKKVIISGSDAALNSLTVTNGITGSLFGTASFAVSSSRAISAASALQASTVSISGISTNAEYAFPLILTGSSGASMGLSNDTNPGFSYNASTNLFKIFNFQGTGSLFGTASWAENAQTASFVTGSNVFGPFGSNSIVSASFASTASFVNTLNQNVIITGSSTIGSTSSGPSENTLTLGARDNGSEGGQIGFNAPGGTYTSASFIDNYNNFIRILKGTNAGSTGLVAQWNLHNLQMQLPAYTSVSSFPGTAAANLAVDSSGNIITVSTSGGTVFPYTGNAVITGSLTTTGAITSNANGAMYFRGGDDAEFWDINVANTVGIYGQQTQTEGGLKLGSSGATLYGSGSRFGINTTTPTSASLTVNGNVWATSFTGSLSGNATTATTATNANNIAVTDTTTGTGPYYLVFTDGTTGNRTPRIDSNTLTFNASTNELTVPNIIGSGSLSGTYSGTSTKGYELGFNTGNTTRSDLYIRGRNGTYINRISAGDDFFTISAFGFSVQRTNASGYTALQIPDSNAVLRLGRFGDYLPSTMLVVNGTSLFENTATSTVDFRAPIFYDSNDTGYYIDPASTSNLNLLNISGQRVFNTIGGNTISGNINPLWGYVKIAGNKLYPDDQFNDGNNSVNVYNNNGGSAVTITRRNSGFNDSTASPVPNSSGFALEIRHAPGESAGIQPGFGGFFFGVPSSPGSRRLLCTFRMKIPVGRTVEFATNSIGTNGQSGWLTSNAGTGQYQDYAYVVHSGTASFSTTMFFFINGGSSTTFFTYLASATVYDVTNLSDETVRNYNASSGIFAPIFYDSNDTGYYLDPASTSVVNTVRFGTSTNNGRFLGDSTWGVRFWTDSGFIWLGPANTGTAHIYTDRPSFYMNVPLIINGGTTLNQNDVRSPIFYDSNNTGFYVDPASTSNLADIRAFRVGTYVSSFYVPVSSLMVGNTDSSTTSQLTWESRGNYTGAVAMTAGGQFHWGGQGNSSWFWKTNCVYNGDYSASGNTVLSLSSGGTLTAAGDVIAFSDARVKENIRGIENPLEKVLSLRGVSYTRTDVDDKSTKIGVIAQETRDILPEVVQENEDGMLGVSYGNMAGLFIEAIKEQQQIIENQQKQIDELKELVKNK